MPRYIDADAIEPSEIVIPLIDGGYEYVEAVYMDDLRDIPTADVVEMKRGYFIGTEFDGYADGYPVFYEWKCSECGCIFEDEEPTYNYCPQCGAKMGGKETEDETVNMFS